MEEVEAKIVKWLKEEKLSPKSVEDPNAFFNYRIQIGGTSLSVNQNTTFSDSITVSCSLQYSEDQLTLLSERMNNRSKREYFNKIKTALTLHPYIWNFNIDENKGIRIHSKRLYYEALTKDNLMHMVYLMAKMFKLPIRLIDDYFQEFWPEWKPEEPDNPDLEKMR